MFKLKRQSKSSLRASKDDEAAKVDAKGSQDESSGPLNSHDFGLAPANAPYDVSEPPNDDAGNDASSFAVDDDDERPASAFFQQKYTNSKSVSEQDCDNTVENIGGESAEASSSRMAIQGLRGARSSADDLKANDDDLQISSSPTKRHSFLGTTLQRLHLRNSSSSAQGALNTSANNDGQADNEPGRKSLTEMSPGKHIRKYSSNRGGSGKHTPNMSKDATGDFAQFLEAEELKDALEREKREEMKRELKATKAASKHRGNSNQYAGHGLGGKGKPESPEERWQRAHEKQNTREDYAVGLPTLEQRGYFPGDLRHHGHLEVQRRPNLRQRAQQSTSSDDMPKSEHIERIRPPGICGPVSDSSGGEESGVEDNPGTQSKSRKGRDSEASSIASGSSTIAEPHDAEMAARDVSSSVISLKSSDSHHTANDSLVSGGANPKLAKPLLELEELELDSFIKNFGRHTREVRVGRSANFPQRRMPRWEDFKVPPGEAALAAAQGKRVTVLTHVDRGLRVLEETEGEGVPRPRGADPNKASRKLEKRTREARKGGKFASASNSDAEDVASTKAPPTGASKGDDPQGPQSGSTNEATKVAGTSSPNSPQLQRISWAPTVEKDRQRDKDEVDVEQPPRTASPTIPLAGLRKSQLEKDEKLAKKQEREDGTAGLSGANWIKERDGIYSIHDEDIEYRPSRDESGLDDESLKLLHNSNGEVDLQVDDDSQVDGVAWAIAYILATIERYAPEELDNSPDQKYRESKTRSHIERLYLIAPFWERFLFGVRRVYRWDNPRRTSSFMMCYFVLWYMNLLATAFMLIIVFYTCQFRFFPPSASMLHEQVRARMARGVDADRLAERLRRRSRLDVLELYKRFVAAYGSPAQLACGDVADFHEKVKNLILWRNTRATWRTLTLLGIATVFVTFAPAAVISKTITGFVGFTFFILLPLQSHYPRFRRPLSPVWWVLWGAPTDQQFAIQLLRRRHLERQRLKHPPTAASTMKDGGKNGVSKGDGDVQDESSTQGETGTSFKNRLFQRSAAAQAVAFGALRPFKGSSSANGKSQSEKLLDLQTVKVLKDGEVESRPRKLGSFFCQHRGVPGHLNITTRMLYFVSLHSHADPNHGKHGHKTCKTPLQDVSGIVKTKSLKLLVWNSSGLQVLRRNKSSLFFSNMPHRDNAFNLLLAIGSEVWHDHE